MGSVIQPLTITPDQATEVGRITVENLFFPLLPAVPEPVSGVVQSIATGAINCTVQSTAIAANCNDALARYLEASLAGSTRRAYAADVRAFIAGGGLIPSTPGQVAGYLARWGSAMSPHTLARRLIALGRVHRLCGHPDPCSTDLVRATLRGIRRVHGTAQRRVEPLLREQLPAVLGAMPDNTKGIRDRALLLVGFAAALRRSELVALQLDDLRQVPEGVELQIRRSKTDQEGRGRAIVIPRTDSALCPVAALQTWLDRVGAKAGPVFRRVDRPDRIGEHGLSSQTVALVVKQRVNAIGLDPACYAGHSLRAGFISSAARLGLSTWRIRQQSGHGSDAVMQRYVRGSGVDENAASVVLRE